MSLAWKASYKGSEVLRNGIERKRQGTEREPQDIALVNVQRDTNLKLVCCDAIAWLGSTPS